MSRSITAAGIVLGLAGVLVAAGVSAQNGERIFTEQQATAGQTAYLQNCAVCHGKELTGQGEAPELAGQTFFGAWKGRGANELFSLIQSSMPYGNGNSLDPVVYRNIVSYILFANGAKPGSKDYTGAETSKLGQVTDGEAPKTALTKVNSAPVASAKNGQGMTPPATSYPSVRFGQTVEGTVKNFQPVTDAMLDHPKEDDWLMYRGNYAGWSYSPLTQINAANVENLQLQWVWAMNDGGASEVTPIVHDGIMYLSNVANTVQALDARTGELIWENRLGPAPTRAYGATRALALYGDRVFVPTTDAKLYALDARTGKVAWKSVIADASEGYSNTGGAIAIHGKILVGLTYCNRYEEKHCFISAWDSKTGKLAWKFQTIALKGQPGGDTWNGIADPFRQGAETWIAGTYDPDLNTTYWGTAQSKPWAQATRGTGAAATLYANSTLALDPDTGKLKWHYSHAPGESLDLDEVYERVLVDYGKDKSLLTVGKAGVLWKLNRVSGAFEGAAETVFQNIYTSINPKTGVPTYRKDIREQKIGDWLSSCPGPAGGHDWPATSYDPNNDLIVIPLAQSCVMFRPNFLEKKIGQGGNAGSQEIFSMPGTGGNLGRLAAYNAKTLEPVWSFQQKAPFLTSVLTTGGNVAFVGDFDRRFRAVDTRTGQTLWKTRLGTTVQGHVISFAVDGHQYIAVEAGLGGGSPVSKAEALLPQVHHPRNGNAIYVFALPEKKN